MTLRERLPRLFRTWPVPVVVAAGFTAAIALGVLLVVLLPSKPDPWADCKKQCDPRFSRLAPDTNYPMSAKGTYRLVCECY
jgi:hypothetical protein